ncbi:MAG: glycosyltransferase family 9 protein [Candidatus Wallbacteria bacterium]|nr:glycosyltransferase family 9 protein [Candidatus Wallbacteria bacterium]
MSKKILIFGHSNIGDAIYDLVVINPLREKFPDAEIVFVTTSRCRSVVDGYKGLNRVLVFDKEGKDRGWLSKWRFTSYLRKEKFDLVVLLKNSMHYLFLGVPHVWRVKRPSPSENRHSVDRFIEMLNSNGVNAESASFSFSVNESDAAFCDELLQKNHVGPRDSIGGILPLAAWSMKSWPIEKWNLLAEILKIQHGIRLVNLGKFPDNAFGKNAAEKMSDLIIAADDTTLAQAKALLQRCSFFIGPDSSLLHLASCMGIETIGLFGATSCDRFYPYFHQHNVIRTKIKMNCMPCYPGPGPSCSNDLNPRDFGLCMETIETGDVLELLKKRLILK